MADTSFHISREELSRVFNPRARRQFETLQQKVSENEETVTAGVAATTGLKDATFVTLSPNDELPNEYVLNVAGALSLAIGGAGVILTNTGPQITGGHGVTFAVLGETNLALPVTGTVATREWVTSLNLVAVPGPYANDAAASAGGVAVGGVYLKGTALATRMT